eukprot:TRINITY_DN14033_c0_g1_i1.p1 TRINITY_DN14033_c0_g1~~TRINITY_DN14033_c0_g1_i1.p1  ORF type:complete len:1234 (-),score=338.16 TRINITY_DN14033_c0_g1_i1:76-3777(-)
MKWESPTVGGKPPPPRYNHTVSTVGDQVFIFGGFSKGAPLNDAAIFDTASMAWKEPEIQGKRPTPRFGHAACVVGKKIFIIAGCCGTEQRFNDVYVLDTERMEWQKPDIRGTAPSARYGHSACAVGPNIFLFGGRDGRGVLNDIYVLDTALLQWLRPPATGTAPPPRMQHSMVLFNGRLVIHGGTGTDEERRNDTAQLDLDTMKWSAVVTTGDLPKPRELHVAAVVGASMCIVGGFDGRYRMGDVCALDLSTFQWSSAVPEGAEPSPRFGVAATVLRQKVLMIGGRDASGWLSDVVLLDVGGPGGINSERVTVATQTAMADVRSLRAATAMPTPDAGELAALLQTTAALRQQLLGGCKASGELAAALRSEQGARSQFVTGMMQMPGEKELDQLQVALNVAADWKSSEGASDLRQAEVLGQMTRVQTSLAAISSLQHARVHHIGKVLETLHRAGAAQTVTSSLSMALNEYETWENQSSYVVGAVITRTNAVLREAQAALEAEYAVLQEHSEVLVAGIALAQRLAGCSTVLAEELAFEAGKGTTVHTFAMQLLFRNAQFDLEAVREKSLIKQRLRKSAADLVQAKVDLQKRMIRANSSLQLLRLESDGHGEVPKLEGEVSGIQSQLESAERERERIEAALAGKQQRELIVQRRLTDYVLDKVLAHHKNRKILLAKRLGQPCVLRELNIKDKAMFEARLSLIAALQHPAFATINCVFYDGLMAYVETPYYEGGTLETWLKATPPLTRPALPEVIDMFRQIGVGLTALHAAGVLHGALHFNNVFLTRTGPVLADFGQLSDCCVTVPESPKKEHFDGMMVVAPDVLDGRGVSWSSDVWSFGAMLHVAVFGQRPSEVLQDHPNDTLLDFFRTVLVKEVAQRPTAGSLMYHPLMQIGGGAEIARAVNLQHQLVSSDAVLHGVLSQLNRQRVRAVISRTPACVVPIRDNGVVRSLLTAFASFTVSDLRGPLLIEWDTSTAPEASEHSLQAVFAKFWREVISPTHELFATPTDDPFIATSLYLPQPTADPEQLEAVGRILGKCIADGIPIAPQLAPSVLKKLCNRPATLSDLAVFAPAQSARFHRVASLGEVEKAATLVQEYVYGERQAALEALCRGIAQVPGAEAFMSLTPCNLSSLLAVAAPATPKQVASSLRFHGFAADSQAPSLIREYVEGLSCSNLRRFLYAVVGMSWLPSDRLLHVHVREDAQQALRLAQSVALPEADERVLATSLAQLLIAVDSE